MHIHRIRLLAAVSAATLATLSLAGPAAAHGGQDEREKEGGYRAAFTIQAAVDAAKPGDTIRIPPGTYDESVEITQDHITLRGYGAVIEPRTADPTGCDTIEGESEEGEGEGGATEEQAPPRVSGICILGEVDEEFAPLETVDGVRIRGITVTGASGDGLVALATTDLTVRHGTFTHNEGYGAASFVTEGTTFRHNTAKDNAEAGFYIGDSPEADADVRHNESTGNQMGFFFRNSSDGVAKHNVAAGNCLGMLVLADAPGPAGDWHLRHNRVKENNKVCTEEPPPLSGAGIALIGATDFTVRHNTVTGHVPGADSIVAGGIVVRGGLTAEEVGAPPEEFGDPTAPTGEVARNTATGNEPADVVWDETGEVEFDGNRCESSMPGGLCG